MEMIYMYSRIRKGNKMVEKKAAMVDGKLRVTCKETPIVTATVTELPKKKEEDTLQIPDFMYEMMARNKRERSLLNKRAR